MFDPPTSTTPAKRDETDRPRADEFQARSPDELSLARGDRVELIERDDDFGDGWFLGRNTETGNSGLFPEGIITRCLKLPGTSSPCVIVLS
jgi:hypothetical protein